MLSLARSTITCEQSPVFFDLHDKGFDAIIAPALRKEYKIHTFSPRVYRGSRPKERRTRLSYELMYIVRPNVDEQALAAVNEKVEKFVASAGGQMTKRDDWGKRRLAYPIGKSTEGFYAVLQLDMPAPAVRDLERNLKLTEEVLRFLVVRVELAPAPAPANP